MKCQSDCAGKIRTKNSMGLCQVGVTGHVKMQFRWSGVGPKPHWSGLWEETGEEEWEAVRSAEM